ncbi:hypothetical protein V496_07266 [Pseudogymnoascus sp. VKM F-4515 (FW-2607)]|nr:hypothetical protein V496_07266 [Pseudogymnoascus sp. VKM F-4515 (FW-2607)]
MHGNRVEANAKSTHSFPVEKYYRDTYNAFRVPGRANEDTHTRTTRKIGQLQQHPFVTYASATHRQQQGTRHHGPPRHTHTTAANPQLDTSPRMRARGRGREREKKSTRIQGGNIGSAGRPASTGLAAARAESHHHQRRIHTVTSCGPRLGGDREPEE